MAQPEHPVLDLRGDSTPLALLRVRQALKPLAEGARLEVWLATDRQARDLERISLGCGDGCRLELVPGGHYRVLLERGPRPPGTPCCHCR